MGALATLFAAAVFAAPLDGIGQATVGAELRSMPTGDRRNELPSDDWERTVNAAVAKELFVKGPTQVHARMLCRSSETDLVWKPA
jgi:hypothetical protein